VEPVLARAKWAIGAHELQLQNGQVLWGGDSTADARTAIGIDEAKRLLFLAVGERISPGRVLHMLADLGARDGFLLDGGGSSAMEIGQGSTGIPAGVLLGGGRPVARERRRSLPHARQPNLEPARQGRIAETAFCLSRASSPEPERVVGFFRIPLGGTRRPVAGAEMAS
jgi:hypothetical protein